MPLLILTFLLALLLPGQPWAQGAPTPLTRIAFGSCADEEKPQPIWNAVMRHDGPQAGPGRRGERDRRPGTICRQPRHSGREGLRPGRRPHRLEGTRGPRRGTHPGQQPVRTGRPQGLLSRGAADHHPRHRRRGHRSIPRRSAGRGPRHRDRQAGRHLRRGAVPPDVGGRHRRARPLLHPTPRLTVGRRANGRADLGSRAPSPVASISVPVGIGSSVDPPSCSSASTTPDGHSWPPGWRPTGPAEG